MPRPILPPTPASSTDIKGKDGSRLGTLQMAFELPPPAMANINSRSPSAASAKSSSASSFHPTPPESPDVGKKSAAPATRRRSSTEKTMVKREDAFTLPPPPTRSRKIIQMKPRGQVAEYMDEDLNDAKEGGTKNTGAPGKRKQPSATSVAGRKIARKTAHSLIERRRRSKMNEEFGVLKDMIPACTGEMHKLAILQASIDYVRYLEDCVSKLKAQNNRRTPTPTSGSEHVHMPPPPSAREPYNYEAYDDDDEDMDGSDAASPTYVDQAHSHQPSMSPAILPHDQSRHNSYSSASAFHESRHYSYPVSSNTSPNFGPQSYEYAISNTSALTSPALAPQKEGMVEVGRDFDQEATTALLMLNTDRRGTTSDRAGGGRGMSVRDLLST